jgi:hypothetical protein
LPSLLKPSSLLSATSVIAKPTAGSPLTIAVAAVRRLLAGGGMLGAVRIQGGADKAGALDLVISPWCFRFGRRAT